MPAKGSHFKSEESKRKISEKLKGKPPWNKGKKGTGGWRNKKGSIPWNKDETKKTNSKLKKMSDRQQANVTYKLGKKGNKLSDKEIVQLYVLGQARMLFLISNDKNAKRPEGIYSYGEISQMFGISIATIKKIARNERRNIVTKDIKL